METTALTDPAIAPSAAVLESTLGKTYVLYQELMAAIHQLNLVVEWNYYKDGKAWLCKVQHKKKTVCWISAWDRYFKTTFYFTDKNCSGITELEIDEAIKKDFSRSRPIGKLLPLVLNITQKNQLHDTLKLVAYKKALK